MGFLGYWLHFISSKPALSLFLAYFWATTVFQLLLLAHMWMKNLCVKTGPLLAITFLVIAAYLWPKTCPFVNLFIQSFPLLSTLSQDKKNQKHKRDLDILKSYHNCHERRTRRKRQNCNKMCLVPFLSCLGGGGEGYTGSKIMKRGRPRVANDIP